MQTIENKQFKVVPAKKKTVGTKRNQREPSENRQTFSRKMFNIRTTTGSTKSANLPIPLKASRIVSIGLKTKKVGFHLPCAENQI